VQQVKRPKAISQARKPEARIESEEILAKLKEPNPWNYSEGSMQSVYDAIKSPLAQQIKSFLEKNNGDDIENIVFYLIHVDEGFEILREMSTENSSFAVKLLPLIEKNFDQIDDDHFIKSIILKMPHDQFVVQTDSLKEKFLKKISLFFMVGLGIETVSKLLPADTIRCLKILINMYEKYVYQERTIDQNLRSNYRKLGEFLKNTAMEKIAHVAKGDVKELVSDEYIWETQLGSEVIRRLASDNSLFKDFIMNYLINNKHLWKTDIVFDLMKQRALEDPFFKNILVDFVKVEKNFFLRQLIFKLLLEVLDGAKFLELVLGIDARYAQTPSYRHLERYYHYFKDWGSDIELIVNPLFTTMLQNVVRNEKELIDNGYEVVYHGRSFEYNFLSYIYKRLYSYKSGEDFKDFIFTHLDDPVLGKVSEEFFKSEQKTRERLLAQGNILPTSGERSLESFLGKGSPILFLSKYIFGNMTATGCNSMYLMLENANWGEITITTQEIFSMFGYKDIYDKYEKELSNLKREHKSLSKHGELLQIAIPKDDVDKCVYHTQLGVHGPKKKFIIPGVEETDDIKTILEYVDKNPVDPIEFALINTRDMYGGLNPKRIKVFSHTLINQVLREAFEEKANRLWDEILQDCRKQDEQEKQKAIEWEKAQLASE